jgi:cytochrome P450
MTGSSQVGEYDPFSAAFQADPFPVYRWMRDEAPVFHSRKWGWWALSRFDDVRAAAVDPETFLSYEGIDIDDTGFPRRARTGRSWSAGCTSSRTAGQTTPA